MKRKYVEEILIALSLSNLLFISGWRSLIYPSTEVYHIKEFPSYLDYFSLMFLVVALAGVFVAGTWLLRYIFTKKASVVLGWICLLGLLCIINVIRIELYEYEVTLAGIIGRKVFLFVMGISVLIVLAAAVKWQTLVPRFVSTILLILSPFVLVTFSQAIVGVISSDSYKVESSDIEFSETPIIESNKKSNIKSRVVWIIFDELDYRVTFEARPKDIEMPEFDRLRKESLFATKAVSPARNTLESIPSLIIGKKVKRSLPKDKDELLLNLTEEGNQIEFSKSQNLFRAVKQMGGDTAIVGIYHAYCRVLKEDLSSCYWVGGNSHSKTFNESVIRRVRELTLSIPFGYRLFKKNSLLLNPLINSGGSSAHIKLVQESHKIITNTQIDLALIHLSIPHHPNIYNRELKDLSGGKTYFDNLILTDKVLGEIRQEMEKTNLWDSSTIIVSTDHQWRVNEHKLRLTEEEIEVTQGIEDSRIPFIVKIKNQKEGIEYNNPFNTVVTHDLILGLTKGEITTHQEVKEWLDLHEANK